jgi:hypothetical protein
MPDYWVGYDLGKMGDHTARSVLLRTYDGSVTEFGFYSFDLACVLIERIPLGTPYLAIARDAGQFVYRHPEFAGNPTRSIYLVIDATGVGTGVVEMFDSVFGGRSQSRIRIVPIMITLVSVMNGRSITQLLVD